MSSSSEPTVSYLQSQIQTAASRYQELLNTLSQTDHAGPATHQQKAYIAELKTDLRNTQYELRLLEKKREKEHGEHKSYRDSVMRRFAYKVSRNEAKFSAKAAKEEEEYFEVLRKEQMATKQEGRLKGLLEAAQTALAQLEKEAEAHRNAQTEIESLYASVFSGPTPEFPEEDGLEAAVSNNSQTFQDARTRFETEERVSHMLRHAQECMRQALNSIEEALDASRFDMFGGGAMADMMERNALQKTQTLASEVSMTVMQAQRISPAVQGLPRIELAQGSIMSDVFFDNIFTDMAFHDKIKNSRVDLQRMQRALQMEVTKSAERLKPLQVEADRSAKQLSDSRSELQKARENIFRDVIQSDQPPPFTESEKKQTQ